MFFISHSYIQHWIYILFSVPPTILYLLLMKRFVSPLYEGYTYLERVYHNTTIKTEHSRSNLGRLCSVLNMNVSVGSARQRERRYNHGPERTITAQDEESKRTREDSVVTSF